MNRKLKWTGIATLAMALGMISAGAGPLDALSNAGVDIHGFAEYRLGTRTQTDPFEDDLSLNELRLQLDSTWNHDLFTATVKTDLLYDDLTDSLDYVNLTTGHGYFDLRLANVLFTPLSWMDVKVGRQVLTWGTGDLVFINDLFPKDWQSFFLGRDVEYLKAPSDALFVSLFPSFASIDIAYAPQFDPDRHIMGERISYWNGQSVVGQNSVLDVDCPDSAFADDEIAARIYRSLGSYEVALYGYRGFWKSPGGVNPTTGQWLFPALAVYGGSVRGPLGSGIANLEVGYYDSLDDRAGDDPFINNSEARALVGYEQEVANNLTAGVQYYIERMMDYSDAIDAMESMQMPTDTARDEDRHTVTLRITYMLMNQNLILSCFTRYSPSDEDVYVKPVVTYKISDRWESAMGGNFFAGKNSYTFLDQFENNSNLYASLRCSF